VSGNRSLGTSIENSTEGPKLHGAQFANHEGSDELFEGLLVQLYKQGSQKKNSKSTLKG